MSSKSELDLKNMEVKFDSLLGFIGFVCLIISFINLFLAVPHYGEFSEFSYMGMRVVSILGVVILFASAFSAAHSLAGSHAKALLVIAVIGIASYLWLVLIAPDNLTAFSVLMAVSAIGIGSLSSLWFVFFCAKSSNLTMFYVAVAFCAAFVVCMLEMMVPDIGEAVIICAAPVISLACSIVVVNMYPKKSLPADISNEESDRRSKIQWSSTIMLTSVFFELGFLIVAASSADLVMLCLITAFAVAFIMSVDSVNKGVISEKTMAPITSSLAVASFGSLYLFDGGGGALHSLRVAHGAGDYLHGIRPDRADKACGDREAFPYKGVH